MVNDLLNPKISVPTYFLGYSYTTIFEQLLFNQFYVNSYGTSEYDSRRVMFFVYEIEKLELVKEGHFG